MENSHERLFRAYVRELREAKLAAEAWWKKLIASEMQSSVSRNDALISVKKRWPIGPCAHPFVLAVLRKYWLECEAINRKVSELGDEAGDEESVSPIIFLCDYLMDGKNEKLAAFIAPINYWPIGTVDGELGIA
jgi:hypothetical protein